jgi:DNA polymerase-3 subunit delta
MMPVSVKLIYGTDEYLVNVHARRAVSTLCPESEQTLNLETVNGDVSTVQDTILALKTCIGALRTIGLFGGQKTVWLRDASVLKDKVLGKNKEIKALLGELAEEIKGGLPAGHHLVISAFGIDKRSAFYKACNENGDIEAFDLPEQDYKKRPLIRERAEKLFAKAQCHIAPPTLDLFLEKVGLDTRQLVMEVEKLTLYIGDCKSVEPEDVKAITSSSAEAITWDFTDALGERRLEEALKIMKQLFFQGEQPMGIIFSMENLYTNLLQFRAYIDQGWLQVAGGYGAKSIRWGNHPDMEDLFSRMSPDPRTVHWFRAAKLGQQAKNYTVEELQKCQRQLLRTHEQLVSSGVSAKLIIEMLIIKLVAKT